MEREHFLLLRLCFSKLYPPVIPEPIICFIRSEIAHLDKFDRSCVSLPLGTGELEFAIYIVQ